MKASVVELRYKMKEVLAALDRNETVTITYRGRDRAKLVPIRKGVGGKQRVSAAEHPACGMWKDREDMKDVHAWLRRTRRRRYGDL
jgi:antitoxin (DNA-binding transcriptional repressor) of toxin-antitoxin stability system